MSLTITNLTKGKLPRLPFVKIVDAVLGKEYDCSLVIVSPRISRKLNLEHRGKDNSTNILSFPLDKTSGEIFLDLAQARKECAQFERSYQNFVGFLFIHGLFHLKGYDHSSTMERQEKKIRALFKI